MSGLDETLRREELSANAQIFEIDIKIDELLEKRTRIEQNLHRIVDVVIAHASIEIPLQRSE